MPKKKKSLREKAKGWIKRTVPVAFMGFSEEAIIIFEDAWIAGDKHGFKRGKEFNTEFQQVFNPRTKRWELFELRTGEKLHSRAGPPTDPESEPQYDCLVYKRMEG